MSPEKLKRHIGNLEKQLNQEKKRRSLLRMNGESAEMINSSSQTIEALTEKLAKAKTTQVTVPPPFQQGKNSASLKSALRKKVTAARKFEQDCKASMIQCRQRLTYMERHEIGSGPAAIKKAQTDLAYAEKELWNATNDLNILLGISSVSEKTKPRRFILTLAEKKARIAAATQARIEKERAREQKYLEEIAAFNVSLRDWLHATDAIRGRFIVNQVAFGGLIDETVQRAQRIVAVGEFHHLAALANALCELNKTVSLGTPDPVNAFLRQWHAKEAPWRKWASYPREAVMLAILAARLATEAQKLAASKRITKAAYVVARAVEAVTKAELSHDLVAANAAFYLLAERAMKAGEEEGRLLARKAAASSGGEAKKASFDGLKNFVFDEARKGAIGGSWPSRRQAGLAIKPLFIKHPQFLERKMSEDQAEKTLDRWLSEMPDASTLFAGKRGTPTGKH